MIGFRYPREDVKKAVGMAWPAVLESFFTAFAGLVDSLMVSSLGSSAVAALISVLAVVFADPVIRLCGSESDTHRDAVQYFQIVMGGMIFNCVQMGVNAAQRGAGNTRITMRTNLVSNTINILLNYLLIQGHMGFPALGIRGAALATVSGTVVAGFMSLWSIRKEENFVSLAYILKQKIRPGMAAMRQIIHVGYSVFAEQLLMRIGFMMTSLMAASQGTFAMAAHQVGMNVMSLSFSFGDGLQATAVALIGYSLGAGDPPKAREYGAICRMLGGCVSVVLAVAYFFGGGWLYGLFFEEAEIIATGVQIMRIIIFVVLLQIAQVIYMGCLRGAGDTLYTAIASTISVTVIRTAGSWFFGYVLHWGIAGIWMGVVADQLSRFLFASIRFKRGKWTEIKI